MRVRVLLFAGLREALGEKELDRELSEGSSLGELMGELETAYAPLVRYRGKLVISVNAERAPLETELADGDEVALLPPVSGGSEVALLQAAPPRDGPGAHPVARTTTRSATGTPRTEEPCTAEEGMAP